MSTMAKTTQPWRRRREFDDEFKAGAVWLVLDEGQSVGRVARELGLIESAFRNWVRQARADRTKGRTGLTGVEREELRRLRKENRRLRVERDVLINLRARARLLLNQKLRGTRTSICFTRAFIRGGSLSYLFAALMQNTDYQELFISRLEERLSGVLEPSALVSRIRELRVDLEADLGSEVREGFSEAHAALCQRNLDVLETFVRERPDAVRRHIQESSRMQVR